MQEGERYESKNGKTRNKEGGEEVENECRDERREEEKQSAGEKRLKDKRTRKNVSPIYVNVKRKMPCESQKSFAPHFIYLRHFLAGGNL
jgi:lipocalin